MKIYTRGGDKGRTSLVGGQRVSKNEPRVEAYGTLDELIAHLGYLHDAFLASTPYADQLETIISRVMDCAAVVATPCEVVSKCSVSEASIQQLEVWIDQMSANLPVLENFTLPVGLPAMSYANICRTVCRRSERVMVGIEGQNLAPVMSYINRLSDYLYALGRKMVHEAGVDEILWRKDL